MIEPKAVPKAAKTIAIRIMKRNASGSNESCAAQSSADHDFDSRHRGDEGLFQKTELPVPEHRNARKHRREQNAHADHTRRDELQITAVARSLEHRPQPEAQRQQIKQWLSQRGHDLRS